MTTPAEGPKGNSSVPPPGSPQAPNGPKIPFPSGESSILNSPFAKMFAKVGAYPTAKQMVEMMTNLLKQEFDEIRKSEESWKKSMKQMKDAIEGDD